MSESNAPNQETTTDDAVEEPVVDLASDSAEQQPSEKTEKEPETVTKEQAEKLANDRLAKAQQSWDRQIADIKKQLSQTGAVSKATEARLQATMARLAEEQRRADAAERRALGDAPEPDALSQFEERIELRRKQEEFDRAKADFEAEKQSHADELAEAKRERTLRVASELAMQQNVDATLLVTLTDGTREKMEALAKVLPKKDIGGDKPNLQKPPKPDSGKKSGTAGGPKTLAQLEKMTMEEYAEHVKERDKGRKN